jgi:IS1 family transposase
LRTTLIHPDPDDPEAHVLELAALWSFVINKATHVWLWIAVCRKTRQVVAYAVGDRSVVTCWK